jgi:hypothetical protein
LRVAAGTQLASNRSSFANLAAPSFKIGRRPTPRATPSHKKYYVNCSDYPLSHLVDWVILIKIKRLKRMEKISRIFCLAVTTVWVICVLLETSLGPRNALASALDRSGASFLPKRHGRSALRRRESWLLLLVDAGKIDLRFVDRRHGSAIPEGANWKASRATKSLCLFSMIPRARAGRGFATLCCC